MKFNLIRIPYIGIFILFALSVSFCQNPLDKPEHGFISKRQATKWEESMLTGNGTIGAYRVDLYLCPDEERDEVRPVGRRRAVGVRSH